MIVKNILLGKQGNVATIEPTADLAAAVSRGHDWIAYEPVADAGIDPTTMATFG